jgi:hypothetical protein
VNAGYEINSTGAILEGTIVDDGSGYTDGTYEYEPLTGGSGTGAVANITVTSGVVTDVVIIGKGTGYKVDEQLSANIPGGTGFIFTVTYIQDYVSLYQHEIGTNAVSNGRQTAIESYFETNNLGWINGGPSQQSLVGDNFWLRLERVEPDFIQSGEMQLYITGRPYAQSQDETSNPYTFMPDTNKIDMREQRRELRMKFVSNTLNGDYQTGYIILTVDVGDVRGY